MEYYEFFKNEWDVEIDINLYGWVWGDTGDKGIIELLCKLSKDKNVFEIGTYRGRTTHALSKNAKQVYTFDLGENTSGEGYSDYEVGELWKKSGCENVTQLIGDSLTFDFSPYYNMFDVVFLDAGHSYEAAKNDFYVSLNLLKDGGHMIIDDPEWDGVKQAVNELKKDYDIRRIKNINYYRK